MAGVFLLVLILALGDVVAAIPMAALVAVMIYVSWATFDWHSIQLSTLRAHAQVGDGASCSPPSVVVVFTHNLAYGVVAGRDPRVGPVRPTRGAPRERRGPARSRATPACTR